MNNSTTATTIEAYALCMDNLSTAIISAVENATGSTYSAFMDCIEPLLPLYEDNKVIDDGIGVRLDKLEILEELGLSINISSNTKYGYQVATLN